jgi:argininosuccinate lyase
VTLWHGRFEGGPAEELLAYTVSLPFDRRLAADDIAGSRAHVRARPGRAARRRRGGGDPRALDTVEGELAAGTFAFEPSDEDIHTAVERRVTELAGPAGAKLHTGRSRNDQVATDLRLFTKRELAGDRPPGARPAADLPRPGRGPVRPTCPATPTCSGPSRSCSPTTCWPTAGRWPATSTACSPPATASTCRRSGPAPSPAPRCRSIPTAVAADLGFAGVFANSLDAVSDRDFVAEALFDLALLGVHLSRIGEEIVLWSSEEFGFARLDDAYSTGSSMLPQKKNPDIAELARGKSGRLIGHLTGLLATLKGLPLAYNRDLQEDKEPLFDAVDQIALGSVGGHADCSPPPPSTTTGWPLRPTPRRRRPPIWPSSWSWAAHRSATPTPSSVPWCASPSRRGSADELVGRPSGPGPEAAALIGKGSECGGAPPPAVAVPRRCSSSSRAVPRAPRRRRRPGAAAGA